MALDLAFGGHVLSYLLIFLLAFFLSTCFCAWSVGSSFTKSGSLSTSLSYLVQDTGKSIPPFALPLLLSIAPLSSLFSLLDLSRLPRSTLSGCATCNLFDPSSLQQLPLLLLISPSSSLFSLLLQPPLLDSFLLLQPPCCFSPFLLQSPTPQEAFFTLLSFLSSSIPLPCPLPNKYPPDVVALDLPFL